MKTLSEEILLLQTFEIYDNGLSIKNSTLSVLGCEAQSTTSYFFC